MGEVAKKAVSQSVTQFELSKNVLHNLKHFDLTPTGKLVLLVLVDCYNPENKAVVFPSIEFIADMAGIGLTATKQAIKDLINTGCIIKSKRGKIRGNYNKYLLTLKVRNLTSEQSENEFLKQSESDCFYIEQKTKNKKRTNVVDFKEETRDAQILAEYAEKHGATNIKAYVNSLKISGAAAKIIEHYREKEGVSKYWNNQAVKTSKLVQEYKTFEAAKPTENFKALKAKLQAMCKK